MKSLKILIALVTLVLTIGPVQAKAGSDPHDSPVAPLSLVESEKAGTLTKRLDEINAMDKSSMNRSEKRTLRREVKAINKELNELSGGVYLSVGAIIVIVLLLILLV
jgi:hypothetical protein